MNIISFDIEEWYIEKKYFGDRKEKYQEYDRYLKSILDVLDRRNIKATFMCVGELGHWFPEVIKEIAERGHEIGCHSNEHTWLTNLNSTQLRQDTHNAIASLEDVCGQKVKSYRAPAFSIGDNNKWALVSFTSEEPAIIRYNGIEIKEFPICTTKVFGRSIAYSGGGYFRFFPLSFVKKRMNESDYAISYFHIGDVVRLFDTFISKELYETYFKEKGTFTNRIKRSVKSNLGINTAFEKMCSLIEKIDFVSLGEAEKMIDWSRANTVNL